MPMGHFNYSSWDWIRQNALLTFNDIILGCLTTVGREIIARCNQILSRSVSELITYM